MFAEEALDIFGRLFETVSDCQALTQSAFEDYARDAVSDELTENVQNALDQLATHHNISQVNVEDVSVEIANLAKNQAVSFWFGWLRASVLFRF